MKLRCVIVDDEPLARECISGYVSQVDFLELIAEVSNPVELNQVIETTPIDLVFLDIQTPVINGIDYLKMSNHSAMVIITTAYPSFALEGFQLDVMDYLLKPILFDRFFKAVNKAKDYHQLSNRSLSDEDYFFVKCDSKYERIYFNDILYIQALENYVTIFTSKRKYMTLLSLKRVEENLDKQSFLKVHKSYVVSLAKIDAIENNDILIGNTRIPLGRNYRDDIIDRVVNKKLWKKI